MTYFSCFAGVGPTHRIFDLRSGGLHAISIALPNGVVEHISFRIGWQQVALTLIGRDRDLGPG